MDKYAIIVAGGAGLRMNTDLPKQFMLLKGKPVLWHTLTAFLDALEDVQLILVLPEQHLETGRAIASTTSDPSRIQMTVGGETRYHSVQQGLKLVNRKSIVFVHDGVRCLVTASVIHACYYAALEKGNAVPATKAIDSIRITTDSGNEIIDRNKVRIMQTPQTFLSDVILKAFEQLYDPSFTDEAIVVEKMGIAINLVEGDATNIKITLPIDLLIAERLLEQRAAVKVG